MEIKELIKLCKESNAGMLRCVYKEHDGSIQGAVIALDGPGTQEVLDAIDKITDKWAKDSKPGDIVEANCCFDKNKGGLVSAGVGIVSKGTNHEKSNLFIDTMRKFIFRLWK